MEIVDPVITHGKRCMRVRGRAASFYGGHEMRALVAYDHITEIGTDDCESQPAKTWVGIRTLKGGVSLLVENPDDVIAEIARRIDEVQPC